MGLRGPAPRRRIKSEALASLDPPTYLDKVARAYWRRHAASLAANGLLTVQTADAYALLCDQFSRLREFDGAETTRLVLDVQKAYGVSLKLFHLSPIDKPDKADRYEDFGEFDADQGAA